MGAESNAWSNEFKEVVSGRTNIVRLSGETVDLEPSGDVFLGFCPFHDDQGQSFKVNPTRQTYHCLECLEGGDCFSFLMRLDSLDFRNALELLAQRGAANSIHDWGLPPLLISRLHGPTCQIVNVDHWTVGFLESPISDPC